MIHKSDQNQIYLSIFKTPNEVDITVLSWTTTEMIYHCDYCFQSFDIVEDCATHKRKNHRELLNYERTLSQRQANHGAKSRMKFRVLWRWCFLFSLE